MSNNGFEEVINTGPFPIRFPQVEDLDQDEEWCEVQVDGKWERVRFHDYHKVYKIPGLYETIFYRTLRCNSPHRLADLLKSVMIELNDTPERLRVLDFGAGNGMSGEALQTIGVRNLVGVDILDEAREAVLRDRSWVYNNYKVCDFTNLTEEENTYFSSFGFNTLLTVAALGFGDIPPEAFNTAFNFLEIGGFLVFNIKAEFLSKSGQSGFSKQIQSMIENEIIEVDLYKRYMHRLNIAGEPLYYIAIVARKRAHLD